MKPIVIYLDKHDDEIKLSRKEFEEYINKAYDQGYACGYAEGKKYYPWWNTNVSYGNNPPTISTTSSGPFKYNPTITTPEYNPDYNTITCDAVNAKGD